MESPESLRQRVELFRQGGYIYKLDGELFTVDSWISVMLGQRIKPEAYHHFARVSDKELKDYMRNYRAQVAQVIRDLPMHADFVKQYAGASPDAWKPS